MKICKNVHVQYIQIFLRRNRNLADIWENADEILFEDKTIIDFHNKKYTPNFTLYYSGKQGRFSVHRSFQIRATNKTYRILKLHIYSSNHNENDLQYCIQ
jgi:hypothetical protein